MSQVYMGSGFIPLHCRSNDHVQYVGIWPLRRLSDRAVQGFSIQSGYAIGVHISVNVLRRVAAKLAVLSEINDIICPFSILSRNTNRWCCYCTHKS